MPKIYWITKYRQSDELPVEHITLFWQLPKLYSIVEMGSIVENILHDLQDFPKVLVLVCL